MNRRNVRGAWMDEIRKLCLRQWHWMPSYAMLNRLVPKFYEGYDVLLAAVMSRQDVPIEPMAWLTNVSKFPEAMEIFRKQAEKIPTPERARVELNNQ